MNKLQDLAWRLGSFRGTSEINKIVPAITPTLGDEIILNGGFGSDTTSWTSVATAILTSAAGGQSGNCLQIQNGAAAASSTRQLATVTVGGWYQFSAYHKNGGASGFFRLGTTTSPGNEIWNPSSISDADWTQRLTTFLASNANCYVRMAVNSAVLNNTTLYDTVSLKPITFASAITFVGRRSAGPGVYCATPTCTDETVVGFLIKYTDTNNFVMAIVDRRDTDRAVLLKRIAGAYSSVIAGNITYSATAQLKVIIAVNGTDYSLYYNTVQVGATTAIADAGLGAEIYGFSTYAGNSVGTLTTAINDT